MLTMLAILYNNFRKQILVSQKIAIIKLLAYIKYSSQKNSLKIKIKDILRIQC